jgi:two-component system chemotaxis response regulator CheY
MANTIMIVDDSITVREQLREVLESEDFSVVEADCGEAALEKAKEAQVDMLIVDVNMPGMDGLEMLRRLRDIADYKRTPAFVLTTEASASLLRKGRSVGATAWIVKPFKEETLVKGIRKVLGQS